MRLPRNLEVSGDKVDLDGATTGTTEKGDAFDLTKLTGGTYKILDVRNCPVGTDDNATIGTEVFSRGQVDRYQKITLDSQIYTTDAEGNQIGLAQKPSMPMAMRHTLFTYITRKMRMILTGCTP